MKKKGSMKSCNTFHRPPSETVGMMSTDRQREDRPDSDQKTKERKTKQGGQAI